MADIRLTSGSLYLLSLSQPPAARRPLVADACSGTAFNYASWMLSAELARTALNLPLEDRLELARRLIESVAAPSPLSDAVKEGIRRIEDVASGRVAGLSEEQYRAAMQ